MILALDLSKRSTGWALLDSTSSKARYGSWVLGSEYTPDGAVYCKLHKSMSEIYQICKFEHLYFEEPLHPAKLQGGTNINSLRVLSGLASHAESFGEAYSLRTINRVNISSWRSSFLGPQKRGTKRPVLKEISMEKCRAYGWNPKNDDEADALGILDYACTARGFVPPWRAHEQLDLARDGE